MNRQRESAQVSLHPPGGHPGLNRGHHDPLTRFWHVSRRPRLLSVQKAVTRFCNRAGGFRRQEGVTKMDQPNIALQIVVALSKRNHQDEPISAQMLAEDVAPKFTDVPVALLRLIAAKLLAIFFDPIEPEEIDAAKLSRVEARDVCDFLAREYGAEADKLHNNRPEPRH